MRDWRRQFEALVANFAEETRGGRIELGEWR
jgi:hypothetical protein